MYHYDYSKELAELEILGFEDVTYGNDAMPRFAKYYPDYNVWLTVWSDYPDVEDREVDGWPRFMLVMNDCVVYTEKGKPAQYDIGDLVCDMSTGFDELPDLIEYLKTYKLDQEVKRFGDFVKQLNDNKQSTL